MAWTNREYSKSEIRPAGETLKTWHAGELVAPDEVEHAQVVLANWRACHQFALNSAQMGLRNRAATRGIAALVSQRTKSRASIYAKLQRRPDLKLDSLRDIAGCRAIVATIEDVRALQAANIERPTASSVQPLDYITDPKSTGYRAVHLDVTYEDLYTDNEPRRARSSYGPRSSMTGPTGWRRPDGASGVP